MAYLTTRLYTIYTLLIEELEFRFFGLDCLPSSWTIVFWDVSDLICPQGVEDDIFCASVGRVVNSWRTTVSVRLVPALGMHT